MKPETKAYLLDARRLLGNCAGKVAQRKNNPNPHSDDERELMIGCGTARDWVRWSVALYELKFSSKREQKSARHDGITESVRFNQMWTASNALFAKDSVLRLIQPTGALPLDEKGRFKLLYDYAGIDPAIESQALRTLNDLLGMSCICDGVTSVLGRPDPTMWEVIDQKYSRPKDRTMGIGRAISSALDAGILPNLDGPTLIYGARNWAVHGMLLTSFFRGSLQRYVIFSENITLLLAASLSGTARKFADQI